MITNSSATNAIQKRYDTWMSSIRARDLDAILDIYADDAIYMPPGKPQFAGKEALREIWGTYLQREDFVATYLPTIHVSDAGDMAYDTGVYRVSMTKNGEPATFSGKYVVVWKLIEREWKAVVDMDNDNGPSA